MPYLGCIGLDKSGYQVNSFLISPQKHTGASNEYPQHVLMEKYYKKSELLYWKKSIFSRAMGYTW